MADQLGTLAWFTPPAVWKAQLHHGVVGVEVRCWS